MIRPKLQLPKEEEDILDMVEQFENQYFCFDLPIPIAEGITLYPVPVRQYYEFLSCSLCLTLNKNDDFNFIRHSHFDYLVSKLEDKKEGPIWSFRFTKILELCLHVKLGFFCSDCGKYLSFEEYGELLSNNNVPEHLQQGKCECGGHLSSTIGYHKNEETQSYILTVNGVEIDGPLFNRIRKFIMYQNLPNFRDDSYVHKSIRDDQAELNRIMSKGQGNATLERKICCVAAKSAYKIDEIYDMSIRKFELFLSVINDALEYQCTRMGLMTGLVSLKKGEKIDHWINKPEESMYGSGTDSESYASKIH